MECGSGLGREAGKFVDIMRHTPADFLPSPSHYDKVLWSPSDGLFSVKSAHEACRHRFPIQPWHALVWFNQGVPRWSFIEWLAVWGRLSPKDRMVGTGL